MIAVLVAVARLRPGPRAATPATLNNVAFAAVHVAILGHGVAAAVRRASPPSPRRVDRTRRRRGRGVTVDARRRGARLAAGAWPARRSRLADRRGLRRRDPPRPRRVAAADDVPRSLRRSRRAHRPHRPGRRHGQRGPGVRRCSLAAPSATRSGSDRCGRGRDEHLQRDDGLLAWRWADGGVVDYQAGRRRRPVGGRGAGARRRPLRRRRPGRRRPADQRRRARPRGRDARRRRRCSSPARGRDRRGRSTPATSPRRRCRCSGRRSAIARWGPVATWSRRVLDAPHGDGAAPARPTGRPSTPPAATRERGRARPAIRRGTATRRPA